MNTLTLARNDALEVNDPVPESRSRSFRRYFEAISSIAEKREELVDDLVNCAENFERVVEDKTNGSARGDFGGQSSLYQCISACCVCFLEACLR